MLTDRLDRLGWRRESDGGRAKGNQGLVWRLAGPSNSVGQPVLAGLAQRLTTAGVRIVRRDGPWSSLINQHLAPGDFDLALVAVANADNPQAGQFIGRAWVDGAPPIENASTTAPWVQSLLQPASRPATASNGRFDRETRAFWAREHYLIPLAWPLSAWQTPSELRGVQDWQALIKPEQRFRGVQHWHLNATRVLW